MPQIDRTMNVTVDRINLDIANDMVKETFKLMEHVMSYIKTVCVLRMFHSLVSIIKHFM